MGAAKFLTDEHVARAIVVGLRQRGIDAVSLPEANLLGSSDINLLNYAHADGRIIVTHDSDFLRLHAAGHPHAGLVFAPQNHPVGDLIRRLILIAQVLSAEEMIGHVEFI